MMTTCRNLADIWIGMARCPTHPDKFVPCARSCAHVHCRRLAQPNSRVRQCCICLATSLLTVLPPCHTLAVASSTSARSCAGGATPSLPGRIPAFVRLPSNASTNLRHRQRHGTERQIRQLPPSQPYGMPYCIPECVLPRGLK